MLLDKNEISAILSDWNFWKQDLSTGIKREKYLNELNKLIFTEQILVITGPRRSGKSYLMRQLAKNLIDKGTAKKNILIINFEDPRFVKTDLELLNKIYETYIEIIRPEETPYIFLDEIQEVKGWEKWVLMMQELKKARIIASGSNARLLSHELATLLTGRHIDMTIFPLSFNEFLDFHQISVKKEKDFIQNQMMIKRSLNDYFEYGAFPQVVLGNSKKELLLSYLDDLLEKDLVKRYKIRKVEKLKSLVKFYLSNISSLTTFSSIEKFLNLSSDTVEKFSSYLENIYLLFFLKRFSYKVKEQEKSPRKVYAVDTGLINQVGFRFSENFGRLAENIVFLHLLRKKLVEKQTELFYWKNERHQEIDFVVKKNNNLFPIQVCWDIREWKTKSREIKSLLKGMEVLKQNKGLVITEDYKKTEKYGSKEIQFVSLIEWLLYA